MAHQGLHLDASAYALDLAITEREHLAYVWRHQYGVDTALVAPWRGVAPVFAQLDAVGVRAPEQRQHIPGIALRPFGLAVDAPFQLLFAEVYGQCVAFGPGRDRERQLPEGVGGEVGHQHARRNAAHRRRLFVGQCERVSRRLPVERGGCAKRLDCRRGLAPVAVPRAHPPVICGRRLQVGPAVVHGPCPAPGPAAARPYHPRLSAAQVGACANGHLAGHDTGPRLRRAVSPREPRSRRAHLGHLPRLDGRAHLAEGERRRAPAYKHSVRMLNEVCHEMHRLLGRCQRWQCHCHGHQPT